MRLVSWNVNGIRAVERKGTFAPFLEKLQPDVVCLQEIKANEADVDADVSGFNCHWHSAQKKGYSGTAILSRIPPVSVSTSLPEKLVKKFKLASDPIGNPNLEGRVITAEFNDFYLVNVYTPNVKGDLSRLAQRHRQWDPAFLAHLNDLNSRKPVLVCGDLNVAHGADDLAHPKPNEGKAGYTNEERAGFEAILSAGFVDSFRLFTSGNGHYTWWSNFSKARERNVGWRIDYFLASKEVVPQIRSAEIHADLMGSDHCPVSLTIDAS
jgi:exodeoxyribonuclease-3